MKLVWVALGAVVAAAIGVEVYQSRKSPPASGMAAKAQAPLGFSGGHAYLVTVTLAGPTNGDSTQESVQSSLPSTLTVTSLSPTPTNITVGLTASTDTTVSAQTLSRAVAAPDGSFVNVADRGPTGAVSDASA